MFLQLIYEEVLGISASATRQNNCRDIDWNGKIIKLCDSEQTEILETKNIWRNDSKEKQNSIK